MSDFDGFVNKVKSSGEYQKAIEKRLWKELSSSSAMALVGQANARKIIGTVADVSMDVCLSMIRAYHEWVQQQE